METRPSLWYQSFQRLPAGCAWGTDAHTQWDSGVKRLLTTGTSTGSSYSISLTGISTTIVLITAWLAHSPFRKKKNSKLQLRETPFLTSMVLKWQSKRQKSSEVPWITKSNAHFPFPTCGASAEQQRWQRETLGPFAGQAAGRRDRMEKHATGCPGQSQVYVWSKA